MHLGQMNNIRLKGHEIIERNNILIDSGHVAVDKMGYRIGKCIENAYNWTRSIEQIALIA